MAQVIQNMVPTFVAFLCGERIDKGWNLLIGYKFIVFSQRWQTEEVMQNQAVENQEVVGWVPQDVFEEKAVKFNDSREKQKEEHGKEAFWGFEHLPLELPQVIRDQGLQNLVGSGLFLDTSPIKGLQISTVLLY